MATLVKKQDVKSEIDLVFPFNNSRKPTMKEVQAQITKAENSKMYTSEEYQKTVKAWERKYH